ncbi:NADH dehydrogenase (quinone) subunit G [Mesorhizobium sp. M1C.F.Ca.ET.193.01.1.1]|uniref:NADH-quinone oxidoreductase subunit NuoG n=1 Tax=unclassified Mesorhizobium TaxID=325217 RepID=UPI000FD5E0BA|nr:MULTISPECIES: NADH-quinone oxidoreductase subunit NuoG [unclassified Mesorhizobium]TGT00036.1 NADH dehydrogenase (quinone) subunit G [bacterium M00.F.Ca.ET.177.01.1.1]TGQ53430.1 NADH dehydrogenase (quinone) subunit G [Mesorhizobium sp. M1C.F.Ca.ET.210.01.1.1]TGQ70697.1 NADH dehydrogenase (quinone) subunit G [Mesorhizobium sp. M1C.F.Ca.ET.212.01.1.1]TGR07270.1 NADH dehydrogenase (quinone) subunit G [Mesorhizobium sp. M1C.F.Ca.ET.204.01.1.1]TGR28144.1 NADH dehydrogenase (quinone) subunit G [M
MVRVTIDERTLEVEAGSTVLQAAERLGIDIPTFCYLKRLPPLASCRMCLVEIEGQRRLQPACATAATDGMVVHTNTQLIDETRSSMLDMLLANHPLDCPICDKGGECELQDMVMAYGPRTSRFRDAKRVFHSEDIRLSPVIIMNVNRCIQCQRCVRMCEEVVGAVALGTVEKGMDTAVTGFEGSLASCDQCGNCVEVCPVGALMSFPYRYKARPWDLVETDTVCPHCGTGCQLTVGARKGEFMRVRSKMEYGVNRETLCVRGRFGLDFVGSQDRIERPMIRRDGVLVPVSWDDAGDYLGRRLSAVAGKAAGGLASPRLPSEVLYQFQKLMRTEFRTNNIDCSSRWSTPFDALRPLVTGFYTRAPLEEVIGKDCVLVVGGNVTDENPVTEYLLRDGARRRKTRLLMLSARPSRLDADAHVVVRVPPGGEAQGLAAVVRGLGAAGQAVPGDVTDISATTGGPAAATDGDDPTRLATALLEGRSVTVFVSADLLRSPLARATLQQLSNLLQVLRALGKGLAMQFLFDRANQLGAWDMGVLPTALPGLRALADDAARAAFERAWGAEIPSEPGVDFDAMLELCDRKRMGALYIAGGDPLMSYPDRKFVQKALRAADLLIVQDAFLTDTAGLADVVLPAASHGEESGTFTNNEGRTQKVCKFREPALETRDNLAIFDFVATLRGRPLRPSVQREIFGEIARLVPAYQGLTQDGLGPDGAFTKAALVPPASEFFAPPPAPIAAGGLMLVTGNCLFHNGYLSERSDILNTVADDPYVEISAGDTAQLGLADGDQVVVRSAHGELTAKLKVNKRFPKGLVFVPENYRSLRLNSLMRRGEYPCPVEVEMAHPAFEIATLAGVGAWPGNPG